MSHHTDVRSNMVGNYDVSNVLQLTVTKQECLRKLSACLQVLPIIHPLRQVGSCCCVSIWLPHAFQALL